MTNYELTERLLENYNMLRTTKNNLEKSINVLGSCEHYPVDNEELSQEEREVIKEQIRQFTSEKKSMMEHLKLINVILDTLDNGMQELDSIEKEVITLFYLNDLHWYEVEDMVNKSVRSCQRIRRKAINKLRATLYGTEVRNILS